MRVVWTDEALKHLDSIYHYIAQDNPYYGRRVVDKLTHRTEQLIRFPQSGRLTPEYETEDLRELIEFPYRIIYHVLTDRIEVLAVFHGAQELSDALQAQAKKR